MGEIENRVWRSDVSANLLMLRRMLYLGNVCV